MAALLGRIDSFDLETDNIPEYIETVEQYFIANDVTDEKKQTAIFLTVIGNETYSLLRNLLAPESPARKTVKTLSETLIEHLKPQPIIIAERCKFYCRDQSENETISEYLAQLRKLTLSCDFKDLLDQPNGHIFVNSPAIRRRNSTWNVRGNYIDFERRIQVEIMTSIRCGYFNVDSTFKIDEISMSSPRGFFYVVSTSNDVTSVLAVSIF